MKWVHVVVSASLAQNIAFTLTLALLYDTLLAFASTADSLQRSFVFSQKCYFALIVCMRD